MRKFERSNGRRVARRTEAPTVGSSSDFLVLKLDGSRPLPLVIAGDSELDGMCMRDFTHRAPSP